MRYRAIFAGNDAVNLLASDATAADIAVDLGCDVVADSVECLGGHGSNAAIRSPRTTEY